MENKYSVLIPVYGAERSERLERSILSMFNQTLPPDQVVLVCDGPITEELESAIASLNQIMPLEIVRLEKNLGLGQALNHGLNRCRNELVARMDSDDIACRERCDKQFAFMWENGLDLCSAAVTEFVSAPSDTSLITSGGSNAPSGTSSVTSDSPNAPSGTSSATYGVPSTPSGTSSATYIASNTAFSTSSTPYDTSSTDYGIFGTSSSTNAIKATGSRRLPTTHDDLVRFAQKRNPMNHPCTAFKKTYVQKVGGYRDMPFFEDYDLWARMILAGARIGNHPEALLYMRAGEGFYRRRSGIGYCRHIVHFWKEMRRIRFCSRIRACFNIILRCAVSVLPLSGIQHIYRKKLRT